MEGMQRREAEWRRTHDANRDEIKNRQEKGKTQAGLHYAWTACEGFPLFLAASEADNPERRSPCCEPWCCFALQ
jgi:hypothetical protein